MSEGHTRLLIMKGAISELTEAEQAQIKAAELDVLATLEKHDPNFGMTALSLILGQWAVDGE